LFPDLPRRLRIDFARRHGGQSIADKHHHMAALSAPLLCAEWQSFAARFVPQLGDEFVALIHCRRRSERMFCSIGQICPIVNIGN
jgi:hypothetical protein